MASTCQRKPPVGIFLLPFAFVKLARCWLIQFHSSVVIKTMHVSFSPISPVNQGLNIWLPHVHQFMLSIRLLRLQVVPHLKVYLTSFPIFPYSKIEQYFIIYFPCFIETSAEFSVFTYIERNSVSSSIFYYRYCWEWIRIHKWEHVNSCTLADSSVHLIL